MGPCEYQNLSNPKFAFVSFVRVNGVIRANGTVGYVGGDWPKLPAGARRWTAEECEASARRTVAALSPPGIVIRGSSVQPHGPETFRVKIELASTIAPNVEVRRVSMDVDTAIGMPRNAERSAVWPEFVAERLVPAVPEPVCRAEAERVYRLCAPFDLALPARGEFVYAVPGFGSLANEMTDHHRRLAAEKKATVMYYWQTVDARNPERRQTIAVDARTGKGIVWLQEPTELAVSGAGESAGAPDVPVAGKTWSLGRASGRLHPVEGELRSGTPIVLRGADGTLLLARFDAGRGLVRTSGRTYRPDAALLRAMRAQKAERAFGKR